MFGQTNIGARLMAYPNDNWYGVMLIAPVGL